MNKRGSNPDERPSTADARAGESAAAAPSTHFHLQTFAMVVATLVALLVAGLTGAFVAAAGWFVFADALSLGISKKKGVRSVTNASPAEWGVFTIVVFVIGLPLYAINRNRLRARTGPDSLFNWAIVFACLALVGPCVFRSVTIKATPEQPAEETAPQRELRFNGGQLFYSSFIQETEARRCGKHLVDRGFFDGSPKAVQLDRSDGVQRLRMFVKDGAEKDQELVGAIQAMTSEVSDGCFDGARNVEIHLCNSKLETLLVVKKADHSTNASFYRKACDNGDPTSCVNLGVMYTRGQGVPKDAEKSATYFERACDRGAPTGCTNLGVMYRQGVGVPQDHKKAVSLYRRGCEGGDSGGCNNLGAVYGQGLGVPKDAEKAATYYGKACDGGVMLGCVNLGEMYARGKDVAMDHGKAVALFRRACDQGEVKGCGNLATLCTKETVRAAHPTECDRRTAK